MVGSLGQAHTEALAEVGALFRYPEDAARGGAVGRAEWIDAARGYLAGDILPKVDLAAMKFGLEVRAPFLDHVLAESVMALPERLRVHRGRGKWLLRRIGRRFLPAEIIERRKVGFSIPLQEWLNGPWRPLVEEYLGPAAPLRRLIDLDACVEAGGRPGDEDSAQRQFTLLAAAVWAAESARA
jgi:asparagine synthase (glutamine-hydrolysing)